MYIIFYLTQDINEFDFDNILTEEELYELMIPYGVDYVSKTEDLEEDVKFLERLYKNVKAEKIKNNIFKIKKDELIKALTREKNNRLRKVKEMINEIDRKKINVSSWSIAYVMYNQKGFFFYLEDYGLMNEMDLLDSFLQNFKSDYIYIVASFGYHI